MAGLLTLVAAAAGITFALAENSPSPTTYYACVNNSSGTIKMVDADAACSHNEHKINWDQGAQAAPRASEVYVARTGVMAYQTHGSESGLVVGELHGLPAGSYHVTAQETASFADSLYGGQLTCALNPGTAHAIDGIAVVGAVTAIGQRSNVVVTDALTIGAGTVIKYSCSGPAGLSSDNAVITATRVDTLTDLTVAPPTNPGTLTAAVSAGLPSKPGTCSLSVEGSSLKPGWALTYTVNGYGPLTFGELDSAGNYVGPATVAMDGTVNAVTAMSAPATGSSEIDVSAIGADGAPATSTAWVSAACDGAH